MTNRKMMETLSNQELSFVWYHCIVDGIGRNYTDSVLGIGEWLEEEYNIAEWQMWREQYLRVYAKKSL